MSTYVKLSAPPQLVLQYPLCGACTVELDHDGDGFVCPSCGTSWSSDASDGESGTLYSAWSGEEPSGEVLTEDEARVVADYRERLDRHQRWGKGDPCHVLWPLPKRPEVMDKVEGALR
jgi:predicted RNA-binding Zn-ribbon protein involved in translation (DUF1610 family)